MKFQHHWVLRDFADFSSEIESSFGEQCVLPTVECFDDFVEEGVKYTSSADRCSAVDWGNVLTE